LTRANVKITAETLLSDNWAKVRRYEIDIERRDGVWQHQVRETYDRGNAAAILLFNRARRSVILVRQFRLPVHIEGDDSMVLEVCAGLLDGDDPADCALREAGEETGYRVHRMRHALDTWPSPGAIVEKIHLFVGEYEPGDTVSAGGGLEHEGEDIEVVELAFEDALAMIETGTITDAKTVMLLQYAALKRLFD
jgi:nudix-type nucleoside diphosphatase (YffH/AdpP family)